MKTVNLRIALIIIVSVIFNNNLYSRNLNEHIQEFYEVLPFAKDARLDKWMKKISVELLDDYHGEAVYEGKTFYEYITTGEFEGFSYYKNHRSLFHWGYNSEPWSELIEEKMRQCVWSNNHVSVMKFKNTFKAEQKRRNAFINRETENTFGFASGGKDAAYANALISIIYDVHILGDYQTPLNDIIMDLKRVVEDIRNSVIKLDNSDIGKKFNKELLVKFNRTPGDDRVKARILLEFMKNEFPQFLLTIISIHTQFQKLCWDSM